MLLNITLQRTEGSRCSPRPLSVAFDDLQCAEEIDVWTVPLSITC